jgi:preprotein translocase subunit SecD
MKRTFLSMRMVAVLAITLACSLPSFAGPNLIITLTPGTDVQADDVSLGIARDVLIRRMRSFGISNVKVTASPDGQLLVSLPGNVDLETLTPLFSPGLVRFVDSTLPANEGASVDPSLKVILTGADLDSAQVSTDSMGQYKIAITLRSDAASILADYSSRNVGHYLIITRDGVVISAPVISSAIPDGKAIIAGNYSLEFANILAAQLVGGALPFPLVIVNTTTK